MRSSAEQEALAGKPDLVICLLLVCELYSSRLLHMARWTNPAVAFNWKLYSDTY